MLYWQQTDAILQVTVGRFDELVESAQSRYRVGLGGQQAGPGSFGSIAFYRAPRTGRTRVDRGASTTRCTEKAVETALASYQSQSSEDLTDLVRAHVGLAETRLNALRSRIEKAKSLVELPYLMGDDPPVSRW